MNLYHGVRNLIFIISLFSSTTMSQWLQTSGPFSNNPVAFLSTAAKGDTIFAGSYQFDIMYRSTDNGITWTENLPTDHVNVLKIINNTVYACDYEAVYRSFDFGDIWIRSNGDLPSVNSLDSCLMALIIGTDQGVYKSTDGGSNWTLSSGGLPVSNRTINDVKTIGSDLYAGTFDGVYKSTDIAESWFPVHNGMPIIFTGHYPVITSLLSAAGYIFAGSQGQGMYRSSDGGISWDSVNTGLPHIPNNPDFYEGIYSSISYSSRLFLGLSGGSIYISSDGGQCWHEGAGDFLTSAYVFDFTIDQERLLAATFDGLFRSTSVDSIWDPVFTRFPKIVSVQTMISTPDYLIASGYSDSWNATISNTYYTSDSGNSWNVIDTTTPPGLGFRCFASGEGYLWGGMVLGIFNSSDQGLHWNQVGVDSVFLVNSILITSNYIMAGCGTDYPGVFGGIYKSTDNGSSWSTVTLVDTPVYSLGELNDWIFAGTQYGIYRSSNEGNSWESASVGIPTGEVMWTLSSIGNYLFASTISGIYRSSDSGDSWSKTINGLFTDSLGLYLIPSLTSYENVLYACTGNGVYLTTDLGENWSAANDGFPNEIPRVYSSLILGNELFIGTNSGIWHRPFSQMTEIILYNRIANPSYQLAQNYPNPFNPATQIKYSVPEFGFVSLKVYDLLGRETAVLVNEEKSAGNYSVTFDGSSLSSGVYFYQLKAGQYLNTKKFVLLK